MPPEKRSMPHETAKARWDRNFADLLQELRVAQTGVQILFAFLLTLPFSSGFPKVTAFQKDTYVVALIAAAFATAMIISPVAFHRALFRQGRKPELVRYAHRMATGGLAIMLIQQRPADHRLPAQHLGRGHPDGDHRRLVPDLLGGAAVGAPQLG
jgi:hypothetical protein